MNTYIALLRGINVSGHKKIKMVDLKTMFEKIPFKNVQTYIQSGNVVFKTEETKIPLLEEKITKAIAQIFYFDVPVIVKTMKDMTEILKKNPFKNPEDIEYKRIYYALLKTKPENTLVKNLEAEHYPNEEFYISDNCVYLNYTLGAGKAKLSNNLIERKLNAVATSRNHRTMVKLLALAKEN